MWHQITPYPDSAGYRSCSVQSDIGGGSNAAADDSVLIVAGAEIKTGFDRTR